MTRLEKRQLFLKKLSALIMLADQHDIPVTVFSFYRTAEEQNKLFHEGKSKVDGVTKVGTHQKWLAADLGILNDERTDFLWTSPLYAKLGELAEKLGLTWGGSWNAEKMGFSDPYHVELGDE